MTCSFDDNSEPSPATFARQTRLSASENPRDKPNVIALLGSIGSLKGWPELAYGRRLHRCRQRRSFAAFVGSSPISRRG